MAECRNTGLLRKIHKLHFFDYLRRWEPTKYIINYSQKMSSFLKQYEVISIIITVKILAITKSLNDVTNLKKYSQSR